MEFDGVLEVFSDYVCPWCYFSTPNIDRLKREFGLKVRWVAFPLHPETPDEGATLEDLFAGRGIDIPGMLTRLKAVSEELGLPFGERAMTFNSRKAAELGKWAVDEGRGEEWHHLAFQAYFAHGRNIAQIDVLEDLAGQAGLDPFMVGKILREGRYRQAVDDDWTYSRRKGISAVPTFLFNGRAMAGAQPYHALAGLVKNSGHTPLSY